jgi:alpha-L-fucosidase
MTRIPPHYLAEHEAAYAEAPRQAALDWFREARFGLFMHYGLYSLLGGVYQGRDILRKGAEWIRWAAPIPLSEYARLMDAFTAERFNADAICTLAAEAGMAYLNLTSVHHDGFCLWDTATTEFNSMRSAAGRDLVAEFVAACDRHGLGCFLYYSHGRDWWHPHAPDSGKPSCRPDTPEDQAHFKTGNDYNLDRYLDFVEAQVLELCTQYTPLAGIWLDGIGEFLAMEDGVARSRCLELYGKIHATQPQILVSYKQGLTGTEDFFAPERSARRQAEDARPYEICTTLQPRSWGYRASDDGNHHGADWVIEQLRIAAEIPANLLLNTGPMGDGSIPDEDVVTLSEVGRRLRPP